jgi:diguanylate cyclase (GGDEF)-like protein/PAS domain S-box-containing protein
MTSQTTTFDGLLEAVPDALVGVDRSGVIRLVNHQAELMFGYRREDLVGELIEVLVPEHFRGAHRGQREGAAGDAKVRHMGTAVDLVGRRADGSEFPADIALSPMSTLDGTLVIAAVRDMTLYRMAEQDRARLDRLSAVVEFSADAIIGSTLEGVVTSWNPAAERLFGYSSVQIIGRSNALLSPEDQKTEAAAVLARVRDGQAVQGLRAIRCRRDGSVFMASLTASPIRDKAGVVIGISTIVRSARAMREASEAAQLMSAVIKLSGEAIITSTVDGVITSWNPAAARLFGYTREEMVGRSGGSLSPGGRTQEIREALARIEAGEPVQRQETQRVRKDGTVFPVSFVVSPIRDADGAVIGASTITLDITGRRSSAEVAQQDDQAGEAPGGPDLNARSPATILIVDDESVNRRLLQALLGPEGYVTRTAVGGAEALASIADDPPDLILLDVRMPGLDGREVASALKADPATRKIPIIMVSAMTDRESRLAALDAGAEDFLSQPVDRAELWLRVRNLLRLKELSDMLETHRATLETQVQAHTAELRARTADLQVRTADLQRFRSAMDVTDDAIMLVNRTTMQFVEVNAAASQMLGYSWAELLTMGPQDLISTSRDEVEALYDTIIAGQGRTESLETIVRKDGFSFPMEVHRHAQRSGADWIIVGIMRDITERIDSENRLQHLAHFDALTGLLNRTLFHETLTRTLVDEAAGGQSVAVLLLDLDDFKNVNDTYGHAIGDELLIQVSDRLIRCVRGRDAVGRLGGDEFALILMVPQGRGDAEVVASKIQTALMEPFHLAGHDITVTASIGITLCPQDATDAETLLKFADTAMYQAKQNGRDSFQFFTSAMDTEVWRRLELTTALRQAVKNGEFVLHYQPQVDVAAGHVVGMEALLRWERPGYGLVPPSEFIYALEDSDLIVDVGRWVIAAACAQIRDWAERGIDPVPVSVNVSPRQFLKGDLQEDVFRALDMWQVPAQLLELELTETLLMTSKEAALVTLRNLKAAGVQISIDDFGTGYASLAYLRRFPVDKLKIDISFTREITRSPDDDAIVLAIIQMGHSLNLKVIAEGVETVPQLEYLRRHHCDQIQGYYFSRPLPAPALELLLREGISLPARNTVTAPDHAQDLQ